MVGIVQVFVLLLIVVSFAMVVGVPVILATPGEWEKSQRDRLEWCWLMVST